MVHEPLNIGLIMNVCSVTTRRLSTSTVLLGKKKVKSDTTLVVLKSVVSGYKIQGRRHRLGDKMETLAFDPLIQQEVLFREDKKVKTFESVEKLKWWHKPDTVKYPSHFDVDTNFVSQRQVAAQKEEEQKGKKK